MRILLEKGEHTIEVRKSKFIAIAVPTKESTEVKKIVRAIKKEHKGASHTPYAAVIGEKASILSSSDDGEPKGTAGQPILHTLEKAGITNITMCVARYFGGILLGTGGLSRAYATSSSSLIALLKTEEAVDKVSFEIKIPYSKHKDILHSIRSLGASFDEVFDTEVLLRVTVRKEEENELKKKIKDIMQSDINIQ